MNINNEFTLDTYYIVSAVRENGDRVYCSVDDYDAEYFWSMHNHNSKRFEAVEDIPGVLPRHLFGGLVKNLSQIEILEIKSVAHPVKTSHFGA